MESLMGTQIIFYLVGIYFILLGIYRFVSYKALDNWIEVSAELLSIKEGSDYYQVAYESVEYFFPIVSYVYSYDGVNYKSSRVALNIKNIRVRDPDSESVFWYQWKKGTKLKAYINPHKPMKSVLIKNMGKKYRSHNMSLILGGMIISIFTYFVLPMIL